jgi:tetratricopeptide (TPR) repeat protein
MVLNTLCTVERLSGHFEAAHANATEAVALARAGGVDGYLLQALTAAALAAVDTGDNEAARALIDEALVVAQATQSSVGMLMTLSVQGALEGNVGDFGSAATRYQQAVQIARESGDRDLLGAHLSALGLALYQTGDRDRARVYAEEANEISRESGNRIWGGALALMACALDEGPAITGHDLSTDLSPLLGVGWMGRLRLVVLARYAAAVGDLERAATLAAAAENVAYGATIAPVDRAALDDVAAQARAVLSPEEYEAATTRGRSMSIEESYTDGATPTPR